MTIKPSPEEESIREIVRLYVQSRNEIIRARGLARNAAQAQGLAPNAAQAQGLAPNVAQAQGLAPDAAPADDSASRNFVAPLRIRLSQSNQYVILRSQSSQSRNLISPPIQDRATCSSSQHSQSSGNVISPIRDEAPCSSAQSSQSSGSRNVISPIQDEAPCSSAQSSQASDHNILRSLLAAPVSSSLAQCSQPSERGNLSPMQEDGASCSSAQSSQASASGNVSQIQDGASCSSAQSSQFSDHNILRSLLAAPASSSSAQPSESGNISPMQEDEAPCSSAQCSQPPESGNISPMQEDISTDELPSENSEDEELRADDSGRSLLRVNIRNPTPGFRFARLLMLDFARVSNLPWRPRGHDVIPIADDCYDEVIVRSILQLRRWFPIPPELSNLRNFPCTTPRLFREFIIELSAAIFNYGHQTNDLLVYLHFVTHIAMFTFVSNEDNYMLEAVTIITDIIDYYLDHSWFVERGGLRYLFNAAREFEISLENEHMW